jgi:FkbM family methyltransferase
MTAVVFGFVCGVMLMYSYSQHDYNPYQTTLANLRATGTSSSLQNTSPQQPPPPPPPPNDPILSNEEGNAWIAQKLQENKPFLVGRLDMGSAKCLIQQYYKDPANIKPCSHPHIAAGIYPETSEMMVVYTKTLDHALQQMDALAFFEEKEKQLIQKHTSAHIYMKNRALEPFYFPNEPWSEQLKGKTVLIVHAFVDSIKCQINRREQLFPKTEILPDFNSVKYVQMFQCMGGATPHNSWLETLQAVQKKIDAVGAFDVAIVSGGSYGMPIAAYCKEKHHASAIMMGGGSQLLFGLKGKRWDTHPQLKLLYNSNWMYPLESDTPAENKLNKTEIGGPYWGPKKLRYLKCPAVRNVQPATANSVVLHPAATTTIKEIVRQKKVTQVDKAAFQDKHLYSPQRIELWTVSPNDLCVATPTITPTEKRKMLISTTAGSKTCISALDGPPVAACPAVRFAEDSSFAVCRAKGALGAQDLLKQGGSERRIADTFAQIIRNDGGWAMRPNIVDVGMNEGFFSLLSASLGGNVIAFDMNPVCFAAMDKAISLNGFENSIELRNVGLIKGSSTQVSDETISIQSESCDPAGKLSSTECSWCPKRTNVPLSSLDAILLNSVPVLEYSLLKIDAEGSEIGILEGALEIIQSGRVKVRSGPATCHFVCYVFDLVLFII